LLFLFPRNGQFGALLENLWTFLHIFVSILVLPLFGMCLSQILLSYGLDIEKDPATILPISYKD